MNKIIVIGESCVDEFVYCSAERLAPDLPIPILQIEEKTTNPGMAMNVVRNIKTHLPNCEIETNSNWSELKKTRYVDIRSNHSFIRIDSKEHVTSYKHVEDLYKYELVVISDYNKGFLSESDIEQILSSHPRVFLDTKKVLGPWAEGAAFIKINDYEFQRSVPFLTTELRNKIIHTMGSEGSEYQGTKYPVHPVEVKDSSGAGDSFLAALVVKYSETGDINESIVFANQAASKVVSEKGVTTI
jgi:D-beta-D-heptose 7-phosphate kinase/D-beta-D-heptose 1-phosphate adenosyltransferase